MVKANKTLSFLTLGLVLSAPCIAQEDLITQLDADKDGLISLREAVKNTELLRQFGLIDTNEDGLLSREELAKSKFAKVVH